MSLLAAVVLVAASARVESVYLTTADQRLAVRVAVSGTPGLVAVHREGAAARVSIMDASLGLQFAGGRRFSWTPKDGFDPALLAASPAKIDRIEIAATDSEVSVLLHVPPDVSVDMRRDTRGLLLLFRTTAAGQPEPVAQAAPPAPAVAAPPPAPRAPVPAAPEPTPEPAAAAAKTPPPAVAAVTAPVTPAPRPEPAPVTPIAPPPPPTSAPASAPADVDLAKRLFPAAAVAAAAGESQAGGSMAELYPQLFPTGTPQSQPEAAPVVDVPEPTEDQGVALGPFRVRASVDARYVDADTFVEATAEPTRDSYLEVQPRVLAAAGVGAGVFNLEYAPVFRGFATYDQVNSSSHLLGAELELPVGSRVTLRARDRFQSGVLDTRVVDPGGEYFFGLGRFHRNDVDAGASIVVGPRMSVELTGAFGRVHFVEESNFFDYDRRAAAAGFGFELTPTLRAVASYVYDAVPRPDDRPEAEATAHNVQLSLNGELPLFTGQLMVGYRSQDSPNAGPGGQSFSGLTLSAALQRELGQDASISVYATRSTPVSAFEENAFYVSTGVQGVLEVPLPAKFEARGGIGYQWSDYKTIAPEIGVPREDRILGWFVGLRRPIARKLSLSAAYREEDRSSNIDTFDTNSDGFYLQLEWDIFGAPKR